MYLEYLYICFFKSDNKIETTLKKRKCKNKVCGTLVAENALFLIKVLLYSIFTKSFLDKEPVVGKVVKQNGYEQVKMWL